MSEISLLSALADGLEKDAGSIRAKALGGNGLEGILFAAEFGALTIVARRIRRTLADHELATRGIGR